MHTAASYLRVIVDEADLLQSCRGVAGVKSSTHPRYMGSLPDRLVARE